MKEVLKTIEIKIQALLSSDIINTEKIMALIEIYERINKMNSYYIYNNSDFTKSTYC